MQEFLQVILSFPTVPFTVLLGVVICYWAFVTVGALGVDLFEGAGEGAGKAVGEAVEGAAKALTAGGKALADVDLGGADADLGGDAAADGSEAAAKGLAHDAGILAWLGLGKVPITVSASAIAFWGWLFSALGTIHLAKAIADPPGWGAKLLVLALASVAALLASSLTVRPLHRLFDTRELERKSQVMGRVCTITSGKVDGEFGTASFDDGGAGLLLKVTCPKQNSMKKGDRALIVDYDGPSDSYEVEPVDWLLPEEAEGIKDPARAAAIASAKAKVR
ncbi:MAG: hypothetical protein HYZ28_02680 [Myxococcales bacterium]|nr:hypothetical protein [Myxococcales bacterium]